MREDEKARIAESVRAFRHYTFGIPLLIGLAIRIFAAFGAGIPWLQSDSLDYLRQAEQIARGGWIDLFPNGYPLLIAALTTLFPGADRELLLIWFNILLGVGVVALVYLVTAKLTDRPLVAGLAALGIALWPNQLNYTAQIMTEVPTAFFLTAGLAFLVFRNVIAAGFFIGVAAVIRTSLLPVIPIIALVLLWKEGWRPLAKLALASMIPVLLVGSLSLDRTGRFSVMGNATSNVMVAIESYGVDIDTEAFEASKDGELDVSAAGSIELYVRSFLDDPVRFAGQRWEALWELWGFWPRPREVTADIGSTDRTTLDRLLLGVRFPLVVLAVLAVLLKKPRKVDVYALVTPALVLTVVHVLLTARARYTVPAEPALMILAVPAAMLLLHRWGALGGGMRSLVPSGWGVGDPEKDPEADPGAARTTGES